MRLQRHLNEDDRAQETIAKGWEMIQKYCKPFLKEWMPVVKSWNKKKMPWLFRGSHADLNDIYGLKKVRTNRNPMNLTDKAHAIIDDLMYKHFKIRGRTQCVFTSGHYDPLYGNAYLIFPVGQYKYLWHDDIKDLFMRYEWAPYDREKLITHPDNMKALSDRIKEYKTKDLGWAIRSGNEIMIQCKKFVYVDGKHRVPLRELIEADL